MAATAWEVVEVAQVDRSGWTASTWMAGDLCRPMVEQGARTAAAPTHITVEVAAVAAGYAPGAKTSLVSYCDIKPLSAPVVDTTLEGQAPSIRLQAMCAVGMEPTMPPPRCVSVPAVM